METMSAQQLLDGLSGTLDATIKMLLEAIHAREKERRQFRTLLQIPPGLVLSRLFSTESTDLFNMGNPRSVVSALRNLVIRDSSTEEGVFLVKPSQRTTSGRSSEVHFDAIKRLIGRLEIGGVMGNLGDLFRLSGRSDEYVVATTGPLATSLWVTDLVDLLNDDFMDEDKRKTYLQRWGRAGKPTAALKEKLYVNRGEVRAYVADRDRLRSLLGSILHSLLHPKGRATRALYRPYTVAMPEGKHVLIDLSFALEESESFAMIFGDISSFTSSFKNIWSVLIALILLLEDQGESKVIKVVVGDRYLEVDLVEMLRCYLFLASVVEVEDRDDVFVSLGGMLGISGIDTLAKCIFALYLEKRCARSVHCRLYPRVGGDDFHVAAIYSSSRLFSALAEFDRIKQDINDIIGHTKEYDIETVNRHDDRILAARYCKKLIRVRAEGDTHGRWLVRLQSNWSVPVLTMLSEDRNTWSSKKTLGFLDSLKSVPYVDDRYAIMCVLFSAAVYLHSVHLTEESTFQCFPDHLDHAEGFSEGVTELINGVPHVQDSQGAYYRVTNIRKLQALDTRRFVRVTIGEGKGSRVLIALAAELPRCSPQLRAKIVHPMLLERSHPLVHELVEKVDKLRAAVLGLQL